LNALLYYINKENANLFFKLKKCILLIEIHN